MYKKVHKLLLQRYVLSAFSRPRCGKGDYCIKTVSFGFVLFKNLEYLRRRVVRQLRRYSNTFFKIKIRVFIWRFLTKKPLLSRMGKGVGGLTK